MGGKKLGEGVRHFEVEVMGGKMLGEGVNGR